MNTDNEGWIKHDGRPMPCDELQVIEIKTTHGLTMPIHAEEADWQKDGEYRLLCPKHERDTLAKRVEELEAIIKEREARLNQWREWGDKACQSLIGARDRIAGLEAENARLREALSQAIEWNGYDDEGVPAVWLEAARKTLEGE